MLQEKGADPNKEFGVASSGRTISPSSTPKDSSKRNTIIIVVIVLVILVVGIIIVWLVISRNKSKGLVQTKTTLSDIENNSNGTDADTVNSEQEDEEEEEDASGSSSKQDSKISETKEIKEKDNDKERKETQQSGEQETNDSQPPTSILEELGRGIKLKKVNRETKDNKETKSTGATADVDKHVGELQKAQERRKQSAAGKTVEETLEEHRSMREAERTTIGDVQTHLNKIHGFDRSKLRKVESL